jgi:hypothetical protein
MFSLNRIVHPKTAGTESAEIKMVRVGPAKPYRFSRNMRSLNVAPKKCKKKEVVPLEGMVDTQSHDMAYRIIKNNMYRFSQYPFEEKDIPHTTFSGSFLVLKGRVAVINYHYILAFEALIKNNPGRITPDSPLFTLKAGCTRLNQLTYRDVMEGKRLGNSDLVAFKLPIQYPIACDISKLFVDDAYIARNSKIAAVLYTLRTGSFMEVQTSLAQRVPSISVGDRPSNLSYEIEEVFEYNMLTKEGDCGSILMVEDPTSTKKLVGIHCAGNAQNEGFASILTLEGVQAMLACFEGQVVQSLFECNADEIGGSFRALVKADHFVNKYNKSKIKRSKLHGAWGPSTTEIMRLSPYKEDGVSVCPMQKALEPFSNTKVVHFGREIIQVEQMIKSHFLPILKRNHTPLKLTFEQAVEGILGREYANAIPRGTSAGYPFSQEKRWGPRKYDIFGRDSDFQFDTPLAIEMKERVLTKIERAKKGIRELNVCQVFLKDERRKPGKGARAVFACPVDYAIAFRMYTLDFAARIMETRIENGICTGVNPYSADWNVLAMKMTRHGKHVFAGDFKGYDSSQIPRIFQCVLSLILEYYNYGPEDEMALRTLFEEIYNSRHIVGDTIFEWDHSLPSGNPMTTIINSIYVQIVMMYAYHRAHDFDIKELSRYYEHVYVASYGDDNIVNVSEEKLPLFNQNTIPVHLAKIGLTYTDEDKKGGVIPDSRTLDEISLLKRAFRFEPAAGRYVGPLAMATILEAPYWTRKGPMADEISKDTFFNMLKELSLHGPTVYNEHAPGMLKVAFEKLAYTPPFTEWYEVFQLVLDSDSGFT